MYAYVNTSTIDQFKAHPVKVEVASYNGFPGVKITGLPDTVVKESYYRVSTAFRTCGIELPLKRFVINFTPADILKKGAGFDLPIALALLKVINLIPQNTLLDALVVGELSLTGDLTPINGILPILHLAKKSDFKKVIIPSMNAKEASFFKDIAIPVDNLKQLIQSLRNNSFFEYDFNKFEFVQNNDAEYKNTGILDFSDVKGQTVAIRCACIAAAGNHHLLLIGSPGCGKTMIGERIPEIMPKLTYDEKLEVNSIYSIAGLLNEHKKLIHIRPYRAPHHTISDSAMIGSSRCIGEITLAHRGVLFLDELSEFKSHVLNALREPLEKGYIEISRASFKQTMPTQFLLVAAANPCDCGNYLKKDGSCNCSVQTMQRFRKKLNGPLMDRFDLKIVMTSPKLSSENIFCTEREFNSKDMETKVINAKKFANEEIKIVDIFKTLDNKAKERFNNYICKNKLSIRSINKIMNVSRTIANLELCAEIREENILEAITYSQNIRW